MAGLDETVRPAATPATEYFSFSISFDEAVFTIELFGELDLAGVAALEQLIARAEETSATTILVDLSGLHFIDSTGLFVLVRAAKRSRAGSDRLRFLRGAGQVERAIELCELRERLSFLD